MVLTQLGISLSLALSDYKLFTFFSDSGVRQVAATIATVEARHAAYLNGLNGDRPFPDAFDTALSPAAIAQAVAPYIQDCDDFRNLELPLVVNFTRIRLVGENQGPTSNGASVYNPMLLISAVLGLFVFSM